MTSECARVEGCVCCMLFLAVCSWHETVDSKLHMGLSSWCYVYVALLHARQQNSSLLTHCVQVSVVVFKTRHAGLSCAGACAVHSGQHYCFVAGLRLQGCGRRVAVAGVRLRGTGVTSVACVFCLQACGGLWLLGCHSCCRFAHVCRAHVQASSYMCLVCVFCFSCSEAGFQDVGRLDVGSLHG